MRFSPGDIIIKVDTRAQRLSTRHHVMLVIGMSARDFPIVTHMTYANGKLTKEELVRSKDLHLIRVTWSMLCQKAIVEAAEQAFLSEKFIIDKEIVHEQETAASTYRPASSLELEKTLKSLKKSYADHKSDHKFTPTPQQPVRISCHEWVISIIHYACHQTNTEIPMALQLLPSLAWADFLFNAANNDKTVSVTEVALPSTPSPVPEQKSLPTEARKLIIQSMSEAENMTYSSLVAAYRKAFGMLQTIPTADRTVDDLRNLTTCLMQLFQLICMRVNYLQSYHPSHKVLPHLVTEMAGVLTTGIATIEDMKEQKSGDSRNLAYLYEQKAVFHATYSRNSDNSGSDFTGAIASVKNAMVALGKIPSTLMTYEDDICYMRCNRALVEYQYMLGLSHYYKHALSTPSQGNHIGNAEQAFAEAKTTFGSIPKVLRTETDKSQLNKIMICLAFLKIGTKEISNACFNRIRIAYNTGLFRNRTATSCTAVRKMGNQTPQYRFFTAMKLVSTNPEGTLATLIKQELKLS